MTMDKNLTRYLNDHLAGSSGALWLIQRLAESHHAPEAREFFLHLREKVEADRSLLEDLLARIGQKPSGFLKMAGGIIARLTSIKLRWEGIAPGKHGLLEALEMLALGVQGKRLLWVALEDIAVRFPEWNGIDFAEKERQAVQQRDAIEFWRIDAAKNSLCEAERGRA